MHTSPEGRRALLSTSRKRLLPGRLETTAGSVRWRSSGGIDMLLDGAVVVAVEPAESHRQAEPGDAMVQIRCDETMFFVLLAEHDAERLAERLSGHSHGAWPPAGPAGPPAGPAGPSGPAGQPPAAPADPTADTDQLVDVVGADPSPAAVPAPDVPPPGAPFPGVPFPGVPFPGVWATPQQPGRNRGWPSMSPPSTSAVADPTASSAAVLERLCAEALRWVPDAGWAAAGKPAGAGRRTLGNVLARASALPLIICSLALSIAVGRLRVEPFDGGTAALLGSALVALVAGATRLACALDSHLALRAAAPSTGQHVLATLTADHDGRPLALAVDPAELPAQLVVVPLRTPLPAGLATLFLRSGPLPAHCRGDLEPGGTVLLSVSGPPTRHLQPAGPAWVPTGQELADLLDGG